MNRFRHIFLLIFLLNSIALSAEVRISLDDALELAEINDIALLTAGTEVESGDAMVREATSAALPNISISSNFTHYIETPTTYFPEIGRRRFVLYNDMATDLHLTQPIWLAGKVGMALDAAKTYKMLARENEKSTRASLKSKVTSEYFGLLLVRGVYDVTYESLEQARRQAGTVERMYDVGMASEFDLLRAKVGVKSLEPELSHAAQNLTLAYISLTNRLGIADEDTIILTEQLEASLPSIPSDSSSLQQARQNRPEFNLMNLQDRLNELSLKNEERSIYWPNFFFDMNYRWQASEDEVDVFTEDSVWAESLIYTVSMQIPLFDGFATSARVQKAKIGIRQTKLRRLQLEQGVKLEVAMAMTELKRASEQVESTKAGVELAEKANKIAQVRYEEGISTQLEVLDAQLALQNSKVGLLKGWYDLRVAQAEFSRIVEADADLGGSE